MELHHTHRHLEIWTAPFSTLRSFAVMVLDLETSVLLLNFTSNFVVFLWFMVVKKFVFGFLMETWEFEFGFLKFSSFYEKGFFFFFFTSCQTKNEFRSTFRNATKNRESKCFQLKTFYKETNGNLCINWTLFSFSFLDSSLIFKIAIKFKKKCQFF